MRELQRNYFYFPQGGQSATQSNRTWRWVFVCVLCSPGGQSATQSHRTWRWMFVCSCVYSCVCCVPQVGRVPRKAITHGSGYSHVRVCGHSGHRSRSDKAACASGLGVAWGVAPAAVTGVSPAVVIAAAAAPPPKPPGVAVPAAGAPPPPPPEPASCWAPPRRRPPPSPRSGPRSRARLWCPRLGNTPV